MADRPQGGSASESFHGLLIDGVTPTGAVLGRGSYGQVLEVDWHGTICAAKNVHEIFLEGVSAVESRRVIRDFERECQTWAQLRHPNVVQLLGVYFKKGSSAPILVLEKMDTTLSGYLEQHSKEKFPILHKVSVLRQVAQALSYLHNQNPPLVHHDLSTNNILLCEWSLQAKISDFGMTRAISVATLTRRSSIKGTLAFMAPEALREPPKYDAKLDVFSYGNVILSTLTHQWPMPDLATRYEDDSEQLVALNEFQRREHLIELLSETEKTQFREIIRNTLENRATRRPLSSEMVQEMKRFERDLSEQAGACSNETGPERCANLEKLVEQISLERDVLAKEVNELRSSKHEESLTALHEANICLEHNELALQQSICELKKTNDILKQDCTLLKQEKHYLQSHMKVKEDTKLQPHQVGPTECLKYKGYYDVIPTHIIHNMVPLYMYQSLQNNWLYVCGKKQLLIFFHSFNLAEIAGCHSGESGPCSLT